MAGWNGELISYIAPAAPATRRRADGNEPFLRPEIGFTPRWYRAALGIDFDERWHTDPAYRRETVLAMRDELRRRFPGTRIGNTDRPLDLLTGTYGASLVSAIYGRRIRYASDNWPNIHAEPLSDDALDRLEPPDLDDNPAFRDFMAQVDWIAEAEGRVEGFINWQGVLNNAQRLRGEQIFLDLVESPERCRRLFDRVSRTMTDGAQRLHARQRETRVEIGFFTVSNCLVNMVSARHYRELLLPYDRRFAEEFGVLGIHNCAWTADPYLDSYASIPGVWYIDMGMESDLARARTAFPVARRAIMYTPMDVANKSMEELRADFSRIAERYGPCDLVLADIDLGTPDDRVLALVETCDAISRRMSTAAA